MQELHDQVEELFILERTLQLNDPGVLGEGEDVALSSHVGHLVFVDHLILLHFLDGDHIACLSVSADAHFSESATPDDLEWFEITNCDLSSPKCLKKQPLGQRFPCLHMAQLYSILTTCGTTLPPCAGSPI